MRSKAWLFIYITFSFLIISEEDKIKINEKVIDGASRLPVEMAQVYLAHTTIGTTTGHKSIFQLENIPPPGAYTMVIQQIAYETITINLPADRDQTFSAPIKLNPKIYDGRERMQANGVNYINSFSKHSSVKLKTRQIVEFLIPRLSNLPAIPRTTCSLLNRTVLYESGTMLLDTILT